MWKKCVVLGAARSGVAVAKLLAQQGACVVINDAKEYSQCTELQELQGLDIKSMCGSHPEDIVDQSVDVLIKNPGIPYDNPLIQKAFALSIPVITEVEVAGLFCAAPIIGITGSNGKTTTTVLVGKIMERAARDAVVAGNIGQALCEVVPELTPGQWLVAELSSFQLKGSVSLKPKVAACLNVSAAHLDYHKTYEDYTASKFRLFQNQTTEDFAVLNFDSEICTKMADKINSQAFWFSATQPVPQGAYVEGNHIMWKAGAIVQRIMPVDVVALQGQFNLENVLAAITITLLCECSLDAIVETVHLFTGVEHRLEYVAEISGVKFYNDSKATNSAAALKALGAFEEPIIWIAGGLDRKFEFHDMLPALRAKVKGMVIYGESADILVRRGREADVLTIDRVSDLMEAVDAACKRASAGDVILLSPACASWDMFESFEERGRVFKRAVHDFGD